MWWLRQLRHDLGFARLCVRRLSCSLVPAQPSPRRSDPSSPDNNPTRPHRLRSPPQYSSKRRSFTPKLNDYRWQAIKDAVEKAERALELRRQHFGERHPTLPNRSSNWEFLHTNWERYDRAETLVDQALAMREATLGPDHALVAESFSDLASILLVKGDFVRPGIRCFSER